MSAHFHKLIQSKFIISMEEFIMTMRKKIMSLFLVAVMVVGFAVPFQAMYVVDENAAIIEAMLYDEAAFIEKFYFEPLTDDEISQIYDAVISGNFVQSRSMGNVQVEYLGEVGDLYHVVEITETLSTGVTADGDMLQEMSVARIGISRGDRGETHFTSSFGIRVDARVWFDFATVQNVDYVRLTSFTVSSTAQDSHHRLTMVTVRSGQQAWGGRTSNLATVVWNPQEIRYFNNRLPSPSASISLSGNTGFINFIDSSLGNAGISIYLDFISRTTPVRWNLGVFAR